VIQHRFLAALALLVAGLIAPARAETFAIVNAHIITPGPVGETPLGAVVVRDGRIVAAGADAAIPDGARIIDAAGGRLTPGLIAVNTALGLIEVNSVAGSIDSRTQESSLSAAFDVQYGLNPDSTLLPVARLGGVTRAVVMPGYAEGEDGHDMLFAGQAAMISLGRDAPILFRARIGVVLELGEDGGARAGGSRAAAFVQLRTIFDNVRLYRARRADYDRAALRDLGLSRADLEALARVLAGEAPLIVTLHRAADIRQALAFARESRIRIILNGAEEAWRLAREIAEARTPVLLNVPSNVPSSFERLGATLRNAALLNAAGVEIAISGSDAGHRVRDMRYNAGLAVAHGLPYADAIEAITLGPARIFDVDSVLGSIEPGKIADIVIWDGDPLEPLTQPRMIFTAGREQPMTSRALQLRDRYLRR
jgi:imidazolonepropionase-like amidohydrolase